jgi:hypothetical protein
MRIPVLLAAAVLLCAAKDNQPPTAKAATDTVAITATLLNDDDSIERELGAKLEKGFVVVRVEVEPKGNKPLPVYLDDFLLHAFNDGQKSAPFHPSQIAGNVQLAIGSRHMGGAMADQGGPVWGPGPGGSGRPRRLPGDSGNMGTATSGVSSATSTIQTSGPRTEDPLLALLEKKVLPEVETEKPISGLLYFLLEGKHKDKHLALQYRGPGGRLVLEFKKK